MLDLLKEEDNLLSSILAPRGKKVQKGALSFPPTSKQIFTDRVLKELLFNANISYTMGKTEEKMGGVQIK